MNVISGNTTSCIQAQRTKDREQRALSALESTPGPSIGQTVLKSDPEWRADLQPDSEGEE
ncbi:hypothetical protein A2U01_0073156 [Trifolium medium]|uniref:Uncharacterized protein n=1 Tax=Trifolium medium TaxID=97028 RepID=A0A392STY6_9FABA|nr:hypothetical protein [Trifolium medium]